MASHVESKRDAIAERHARLRELAELRRLSGAARTVEGTVNVVRIDDDLLVPDDTLLVLVAERDDAEVAAMLDAARSHDVAAARSAAAHLAARVDVAREPEAILGIADVVYAGIPVALNVVIDAETRFNVLRLRFAGGRLDERAFRIIGLDVSSARPLDAVVLMRERKLSPIEEEAELQVPADRRETAIYLEPRAGFIDKIEKAAKDVGKAVEKGAKDVAKGVEDAAALTKEDHEQLLGKGGSARFGNNELVASRVMTLGAEPAVDELLAFRAALLRSER